MIIMALKQSRRSVSVPRPVYDAIKSAARERGITMAELVERALRADGFELPETRHQSQEAVEKMRKARGYEVRS